MGFKAHKLCVEWIDHRGSLDFLNLKVLCTYDSYMDTNSFEHEFYNLFIHLGLVHLLVASGSHLLIIQSGTKFFLKPFTTSQKPVFLILFLFVLISNFCVPVTRSFVQIIISTMAKHYSLNWSSINLTLLSSIIYLLFFPKGVLHLSFWLSLCASLCLASMSKDLLYLSLFFFFGLLPFIIDFNTPSLSSILINILITPFLGSILILNSLLYVLIPFYVPLGDKIIFMIFTFLKNFSFESLEHSQGIHHVLSQAKIIYGFSFVILCFLFQYLKTQTLYQKLHER